MKNKFVENDVKQFVAALNFIATEAKFRESPNIKYMIEARNHFAYLQSVLAKIEANILEIKSVEQYKPEAKQD